MARNRFGGDAATWFASPTGPGKPINSPRTNPVLTFWSGTPDDLDRVQYDDLRGLDDPDTVISTVTGLSTGGAPEFFGPDDTTVKRMWASPDGGATGTWITTTTMPIPTTAAEVDALPADTVIPSTAADVGAVPDTRTVNGKALDADVTLAAGDVGAATTAQGAKADTAVQPAALDPAIVSRVSTDLANPASQIGGVANSAIANFRLGQNRLVFLGDSITYGPSLAAWPNADVITGNIMHGDSYPTYALLASDGRWREVANAGVGGNTSADMLARFQTDVVNAGATAVVVMAGMNDAGYFTPLADYAANIEAIAQAALAAKIAPIFVTVTPSTNGSTQSDGLKRRQFITTYNAWLGNFCAENGYPLINVHDALVNTTDGSLATAYDAGDGVHQNYAGRQVVGKIVGAALTKILPPAPPPLVNNAADASDMLAGIGLFAAGATIGTGWSNYHTATGATWSRVADPMVLGSTQRLTMAGSTDYAAIAKTITTGWAVGDRLALSAIVGTSGNIGADVQMLFSGSSGQTRFDPVNITQPVRRGFVYGEIVIPTGTTAVWVLLRSASLATGLGGTGTADFAQVGLRNLTALGVA